MSEHPTKSDKLNIAFSPSAPILEARFFFGRIDQIQEVVRTIEERGRHAMIYGERGVGKTSLANILKYRIQGVLTVKVTCSRNDSFRDVWNRALSEIRFYTERGGLGFGAETTSEAHQLSLFIEREDIRQEDLGSVLSLINGHLVIIFDEFDTIEKLSTKREFADSVKFLSDTCPFVTTIAVGISDNASELIGFHESIQRCMNQIHLPRMSDTELIAIIRNGSEIVGIKFDDKIEKKIVAFSDGFPHLTHLLARNALESAISSQRDSVDKQDFDYAINRAASGVDATVKNQYESAVSSTKSQMFKYILMAAAIVDEDENGSFRATDLEGSLRKITGKDHKVQSFAYHIGKLSDGDRGNVLKKLVELRPSQNIDSETQ